MFFKRHQTPFAGAQHLPSEPVSFPRASYISLSSMYSRDQETGRRIASPSLRECGCSPLRLAGGQPHRCATPSDRSSIRNGLQMNHSFLDLRDPDLQLHHLDIDSQNELQPEVRLPSPAYHVASLANASQDAHYEASTRSPTPLLKGQYAYSDYLPPNPPPRRSFPFMAILLAIIAVLLVSEEIVFGAIWSQVLEKTYTSHNTFLTGYFGSKIPNFVGALIAGILGLGLQMVLHNQLVKDRITLHLWSFILIFVTYMGCCVAAGVAHR